MVRQIWWVLHYLPKLCNFFRKKWLGVVIMEDHTLSIRQFWPLFLHCLAQFVELGAAPFESIVWPCGSRAQRTVLCSPIKCISFRGCKFRHYFWRHVQTAPWSLSLDVVVDNPFFMMIRFRNESREFCFKRDSHQNLVYDILSNQFVWYLYIDLFHHSKLFNRSVVWWMLKRSTTLESLSADHSSLQPGISRRQQHLAVQNVMHLEG